MPYIIDGHNLIAAIPGISLHDPEDERALLALLQPLAAREAKMIFIYFDEGQTGGGNNFRIGRIQVRFIIPPRTADQAILAHLDQIGSEAPNWVIVSSDREIQRRALRLGARILSSEDFFNQKLEQSDQPSAVEKPHQQLSDDELDAWEALFNEGKEQI
jgi:predicted RNA-binding protein with PIN domain